MMKRKKALILSITLGMLFTMAFAGCSKKSDTGSDAGDSTTTITAWIHPFLEDTTASDTMWNKFVSDFESANPNIKIDLQTIPWANRDQKMLTAFASGDGPDVVYLIPDHLSQFSYNGIIEPLDNLISSDVWSQYEQNALQAVTVNNKKYGLPMLETVMAYYYNLDLLTKAGWDTNNLPQTWDDLLQMCAAVKANTKGYGVTFEGGNVANMNFYPYVWQAGGDVLDASGNSIIDSDATKKAMNFLKEVCDKGYTPSDSITATTEHDQMVIDGEFACMYEDSSFLVNADKYNYKWAIGPMLKDQTQATYGSIGSWAISHTSTKQDAAAKWITFLTQDDQMKTFLQATQYFSPKTTLKDMYSDNANMQKLSTMTQYVKVGVVHPAGRTIMTSVTSELQGVLLGKETADQACANLTTSINAAVQKSLS